MALKGDGSAAYAQTAALTSGPYPYSYHFFTQNSTQPTTSPDSEPFSIGNGAETFLACFAWNDGASPQSFYNCTSGGTYQTVAITGGTLATNTWYGLGVSFTGTSAIAYKNGVQNNTATWGAPNTALLPTINLHAIGTTVQAQFFPGWVAEAAAWNVALTANEFAALGAGICPLLIRPQNLFFYAPCLNSALNLWSPGSFKAANSLPLTTHGSYTVEPHPKMIYGNHHDLSRRFSTPAALAFSNNVNLQSVMAGSILGVAFLNNNVNFASQFFNLQALSNNVNFASLFQPQGDLKNNVNFQSVMSIGSVFQQLKNAVNFRSRFTGDVGSIATGRFREHFYG
jgi:hypothetical protein